MSALAQPKMNAPGTRSARRFQVNRPTDGHEREAEHAAARVLSPLAQAYAPWCAQAFAEPTAELAGAASGRIEDALASSSHSLDPVTLGEMEGQFGHDFSRVRVHADGAAGRAAKALDARAWTFGNDVVFDPEHYGPRTGAGRHLLAHELTHVLQQQSRPTPWIQRAPADTDSPPAGQADAGNHYNLDLLVPKQYLQNGRSYSYPNQSESQAIEVLFQFRQKLADIIDIHRGLHRELRDNREEHSTVGFWADTFGGVDLPDYEMWETPRGTLHEVRLMLDAFKHGTKTSAAARTFFAEQIAAGSWRGGFNVSADPLTQATTFLQVAANQIGECVTQLVKYKEGTEHGAEIGVTVCKVSIVVLSAAAGGEAFAMARTAGYGLAASSLAASGAGVITTEASEIGGQIGEMRYGDRKWGDFDYERIAKVGAKSAVTGFIGALVGGKLGELVGPAFTKFAGPLLGRMGFTLNSAGMKWLGGLGQSWLVGAGSSPFSTSANVVMDKAMGDKTVSTWGEFFDLALHDMKTSVELGTFLHVAGASIQQKGGTNEPVKSAPPDSDNGSGKGGGSDGGGGGGGGPRRATPPPVDPYARTVEIEAQAPKVQRGNAPIGSARTLRPGQLEAQTSATQPQRAVAPPADPHARTVEITPDANGAQRGNAAPANARTLTPEEVAREQADTTRMTAENPAPSPEPPMAPPVPEPSAPLAPGPIQDPVAASQAMARASRNGEFFRLINDAEMVRDAWENEGHPSEEPPPAWVDGQGKLTVDTTRVRPPLRSSDVLAGPIQEAAPPAASPPSGQTQESIPPARSTPSGAPERELPPAYAPNRSAPPVVVESVPDAKTAQEIYWEQHSKHMRGETEDPASFTNDRAVYDANWKLGGGEGDSPPAWRDQYGRLNVDATRVNIHQPPGAPATPQSAPRGNATPSGAAMAPPASGENLSPAVASAADAKIVAWDLQGNPISQEKLAASTVAGGPDRVFVVRPKPDQPGEIHVIRGGKETVFAETNRPLAKQLERGYLTEKKAGNLLSLEEMQGKRVLDLAAGTEGETVRELRARGIDAAGMDIALSEQARRTGVLARGDLATTVPVNGPFDIAYELYGGLSYGLGEQTGAAFQNAISQIRPGGTLVVVPLSKNAQANLLPYVEAVVKEGGQLTRTNFYGEDEVWRLVLPTTKEMKPLPSNSSRKS